jgi:tryptophan-rich sensory protein
MAHGRTAVTVRRRCGRARAGGPCGGAATPGAVLAFVVLCELAGLVGLAHNDADARRWYDTLDRPAFATPDAVFGPVSTVLYAAMGVAAWLVWRRPERARRGALAWFSAQLARVCFAAVLHATIAVRN